MSRSRQPPAEFLAQAFTRRGSPDDLPYSSNALWTIRQHVLDAVQGVKYNIPVSIWLPENYPNVPPIMYVVPTPDMIIKPRHAFVDASGIVSSTYLRNWSQPHSSLMMLCNDVSIQFGQDPPLFSKPPGWVPPAPTQHQLSPHRQQQPDRSQSPAHQQAAPHNHTFQAENPMIRTQTPPPSQGPVSYAPHNIWGGAMAAHQAAAGGRHPPTPPPPAPPSPYQQQPSSHQTYSQPQLSQQQQPQQQQQQQQHHQQQEQNAGPSKAAIEEAFRKAAIAALTKRLQQSVGTATALAGSELDSLFSVQAKLVQRADQIKKGVEALTKEREALETSVLDMAGKSQAIDRWLSENEAKLSEGEVDVDSAIVAADSLCQQALDCQAEDMAIEDTLYALERALTDGHLPADTYLKQVRSLCRKQYFVRALGIKIAARQHHHPPPPPQERSHGRQNPYGFPADRGIQMTQGDSWANTGILSNPLAGTGS